MDKNFNKLKKQVKGITLVALVVTIIVLLILAGVALNLSLGEDGIFKRAQEGARTYQNASQNEKIELDKVSNYIDDYLNGNKDDEDPKPIESTLGLVTGEERTNTEVNDSYGNKVVVPAGFKIVNPEENVTDGIIIEDVSAGDSNTKGNQYVWVPIGNVKYNIRGEYKTINLGRYDFESNSSGELKQSADNYTEVVEIDVGQEYNYIERTSEAGNTMAKNLGDYITKAKNAGGYYIGRYEAGKVEDNENLFNIKEGQTVYNNITQPNAVTLARNLYSSNNNFESDLINSYAWDTAIVFIQTFSGDPDYSKQKPLQTTITTTGNSHDSSNNYDVRCNIYDVSGNVCEWSTETYTSNNNPYVGRGGSYFSSNFYTAIRTGFSTSHFGIAVGFRATLYLEPNE